MTSQKPPYPLGSHATLNDGVAGQFGDEVTPGDIATVLQTVTDEDGDEWVWVWCGGRYLCKPEWLTVPHNDPSGASA